MTSGSGTGLGERLRVPLRGRRARDPELRGDDLLLFAAKNAHEHGDLDATERSGARVGTRVAVRDDVDAPRGSSCSVNVEAAVQKLLPKGIETAHRCRDRVGACRRRL
jgi:hypothetical protein